MSQAGSKLWSGGGSGGGGSAVVGAMSLYFVCYPHRRIACSTPVMPLPPSSTTPTSFLGRSPASLPSNPRRLFLFLDWRRSEVIRGSSSQLRFLFGWFFCLGGSMAWVGCLFDAFFCRVRVSFNLMVDVRGREQLSSVSTGMAATSRMVTTGDQRKPSN